MRGISPTLESGLSLRNELPDGGGFREGHVALVEIISSSGSSERHDDVRRINGYPVCHNSAIDPDHEAKIHARVGAI